MRKRSVGTVITLLVGAITFVLLTSVGEGGSGEQPARTAVTPLPSPALPSREQAVVNQIARVMGHFPPSEGAEKIEQAVEGCVRRGDSQAGVVPTGRHAVEIAANPPPGYVGAYSRVSWGEYRGQFVVVFVSLDCEVPVG